MNDMPVIVQTYYLMSFKSSLVKEKILRSGIILSTIFKLQTNMEHALKVAPLMAIFAESTPHWEETSDLRSERLHFVAVIFDE
uniref:SFRICE_030880 n=1 Tax=Spodoptera frugiperda TaxID=7108 RepID=A0A2H1V1K7_SPOFR